MKLNYKSMTYDELITTVQDIQKELFDRGTATECYNVAYNQSKEKVPTEPVLLTGDNRYVKITLKEKKTK